MGAGPQAEPSRRMETHALGIPDTSLSGRSTRTALSVRRSNSVPTVAKMLQEKATVRRGAGQVDGQAHGTSSFPLVTGHHQVSSIACHVTVMVLVLRSER